MSKSLDIKCKECGTAPVNHRTAFINAWVGINILPILEPFQKVANVLSAGSIYLESLAYYLLRLLVYLNLAPEIKEPDVKNNQRDVCLWRAAKARGIELIEYRPFGFANKTFVAKFKNQRMVFQCLPRPRSDNRRAMDWMDDKSIMANKFLSADIPVPRGTAVAKWSKARDLFSSLNKPLIVKPILGSRGRHTTIHINDEKEFKRAFFVAKQICPQVMISEELEGSVFRATVIGHKLIGVIRRDSAAVIGNGTDTISNLIIAENKKPARLGPVFHQIILDETAQSELTRQGYDLNSVPKNGVIVSLGLKTSRGAGGGLTDVTDIIHPDNAALFIKASKVLDTSLVGIDFIILDITKSWRDQPKAGIIECNSTPFIDLHYFPLNGQSRDTAGALWDIVFC